MEQDEFQRYVMDSLRDLNTGQAATTAELKGVVTRLDKVNGSVGRHENKLGLLQLELSERAAAVKSDLKGDLVGHILNCPWRVRVEALEAFVTDHRAKEKANDHWLVRLWPLIYATGGAAFYLMLMHASELLRVTRP